MHTDIKYSGGGTVSKYNSALRIFILLYYSRALGEYLKKEAPGAAFIGV